MSLYEYILRIVVIGDCSVGKTAFTNRLTEGYFSKNYEGTIGVDYGSTIINIHNHIPIKCQLWDTAGQETFAPLITTYYKDVAGIIMVFDISKRRTFEHLDYWLREIKKNRNSILPVPIVLIGNKTDIQNRVVSHDEAFDFAVQNGLLYQETSVKNNTNVDKALNLLCEEIYREKETNPGIKESSFNKKFQIDGLAEEDNSYSCGDCNIV